MVIVHPLRPRIVAGIVLAVIFVIWLVSAAIALPSLVYASTHTYEYHEGSRVICFIAWPDGHYGIIDFWYVAVVASCCLIPSEFSRLDLQRKCNSRLPSFSGRFSSLI